MLSLGLLTACQESPEDKIRVAPGQAEFARAEISMITTTIMTSITIAIIATFLLLRSKESVVLQIYVFKRFVMACGCPTSPF